jgi:hypothetical protein
VQGIIFFLKINDTTKTFKKYLYKLKRSPLPPSHRCSNGPRQKYTHVTQWAQCKSITWKMLFIYIYFLKEFQCECSVMHIWLFLVCLYVHIWHIPNHSSSSSKLQDCLNVSSTQAYFPVVKSPCTFRNSTRKKIKSHSGRLSLDKWYHLRWAETSWLQLLRRSKLFWPINSTHPASFLNNTKQDILPWFVYIYMHVTCL